MKNLRKFLFSVLLAFVATFLPSCGEKKEVKPVAIVCESAEEGDTLLTLMDKLVEDGSLKYEMSDGMILSINGTANGTNSYWMLYTSDEENSNADWGTYRYEGQTLGSATLGASELPVAAGEVYVWVYQSF